MKKISNDLRQIYFNDDSVIKNTEENTIKSIERYSMLFEDILETTKDNPVLQKKLFELDEIDGERLDEMVYEGYVKGLKICLDILEQQGGKTSSLLEQYYKIEVYGVIHHDVTELLKLYQNLLSNYLTLKDIISKDY